MGSVLWIDFLKASIMASKFVVFTAILVSFQGMDASKECPDVLKFKKISNQFPMYVAHGSHSLTLNDIQAFFKPNANEKNGISIVNFNLTDDDILLQNAPLIVSDKRFSSSALFALDHVLSHMEDNEYGIKNGNALDRVAHALHMRETWQNAAKVYKKLTKRPKKLCSCLDQVYDEWITKSLLYIAKQIREPETMYTHSEGANNKRRPYNGNYGGGCCGPSLTLPPRTTRTPLTKRTKRTPRTLPTRPTPPPTRPTRPIPTPYDGGGWGCGGSDCFLQALRKKRSSKEEAIPNIVDEETWKTWKDMTYANMDEDLKNELSKNLAHFLNCKLN